MSQKYTLGIALAFALTACGSAVNSQSVMMTAVGGSGQMGTALLTQGAAATTLVVISTSGGSDSGTQAAHIHNGVCGSGGTVFTALSSVTNGSSSSTISYALSALTGGKYYINVHNSADPAKIQACGQIQ